ncbi:MAG TPA: RNA pseudouridine synthase [Dongiaceae bacterium]|jgi:tRNA pseudouridine32 synthase/23S rRNA pseudouridine746 synthase/23S rRNA pseudouridine1911/1915/1917 synthase|nr:RNA pseudouridine synthase [Dongiaceae bacterium]
MAKPPLSPEETQARLLYRDGLILVLDKPAGLPVHAGPGGGPNLEQCFDALRFGLKAPPALAHRLDRDTSGCLVLGRHRKALSKLGRLFQGGLVDKTYWAVVVGAPPQSEGRIEAPLLKTTRRDGGWRMNVDPKGQAAATNYRVLGSGDGLAWLELKPETGRTHQVRVHCAELGCPILGEPMYGSLPPERRKQALHLHARGIVLPLSKNKPPIAVTAEPPEHMRAALASCGWK